MNPRPLLGSFATLVLGGLAFLPAACGGGGAGVEGKVAVAATLRGDVVERDGSTSNVQGVRFTLVESGEARFSDADGTFEFRSVPTGQVTLAVSDPLAVSVSTLGIGGGEEEKDELDTDEKEELEDDGDEMDDHHCTLSGVTDGETIEIRVHIENGEIVSCEISRSHEDDDEVETEVAMEHVEGCPDADAAGELEIEVEEEDGVLEQELEVDVEGFTPGETLEAFIVCGEASESLGTRVVDEDGEAEWEIETDEGDVLPMGVLSLEDLVGCTVEVRHGADVVVCLTVEIPPLPPPAEDDEEEDDEEEDEEDEGDEEGDED